MVKFLLAFLIGVAISEKVMLTAEELEPFDGRNGGKIYIGCAGLIFDVTESTAYQPKGSYGMFAGRDITVALGKNSFDKKWLTANPEEVTLTEGQKKSVEGWKDFFAEKYPIVGEVVPTRPREDI